MENILDINFDYYNISNKFKFNLQTKIKFDENSNNNNCENSYLFIGIDNMKELLFIKNFIGIKKFLFYDKSDIEIIKNPIMYKIFNDSDITNIYAYNDDLVILLNELGINAITINYKNNSIELKKNNFELEKYNKNILIVVDNKNSLGIYKHTQILNEELNATINYIDNNKIDICIFNNYDIIILQNTFIDLSYTNINNRKLIYVFHKNYSNFTQEQITIIKNNDKFINFYVYINNIIKNSIENNIILEKQSFIIENQIKPIQNEKYIINGLYISSGSYNHNKNHMKLIEEFSNLEKNKFNLEIYGKIDDINYYNELLNFINNNNLSNIKLFDFTEKYTERLKEAEYFCLYSINETSNYSILEAISLNKKIICSEECIVSDIIKYYPNKNKNFDLIFNLQNYTSPKNIFTQQYLNLILYENINIKKYIGLEIINEDTLDKIVENEISNQIILKPGLSFLLRIKNEEYYILNNIYGIYDVADEIIICDNNSTDDTVNIMKYFNKYYTKIFVYNYNITINNIRSNNNNNYKKQISTFYNWCLSKATRYNVIKWDGDFESIQINLKNMITKYNSHFRNDNFAIWFGGLTKFYNYYINISSYYDEYRCFSKLNGFKWHDTNICETSDFYIKNCPTKYINGYDDIINKIWLGNDAKKFDIKRKPIFIENKNFKDFKEYVIDTRCLNDNKILINFKNNIINHKIKKEIIFLTILNTDNIGGIESFNSILYDLFINFIDVKFIVINNDCTLIDNTNNYFSLEYFRKNMNIFNSYNLKIITSFEIFNLYELKTIKNNFENINLYGITHSEVSYYNKYFSENSDYFEKIITINKQTYNKYKKINIKNVILLHNNINEINKISNIYTFNKENIKILFFSRSSYDKNVIMLLYAINKIIDKGYKVIIDLYTDNNNTINFYHNLLKNKSSINFKKFTNNKDIYLDYDFCILPSVSEGCSMNILESINYQIPILCTMIQSNNEIINNYLPMFNFNNLDNISNLFIYNYNDFLEIIGYETSFNNTQLGILTPYITNNKNKIMIFENNLNEIVNKIEELINNYDFYKNKTIELKNFIRNKYFNIKKYIQEINNLILYNHNIIDYEVE